jgi:DnaK suppressor protein
LYSKDRQVKDAMNALEVLRYKNLLLSQRQELSTGKSVVHSIPAAGSLRGDQVDMASGEAEAATEIQIRQADWKLLSAIEDALARIRHAKYGTCIECGHAISKARLEAVPWTEWCRDCKERLDAQR